MKEPDFKLFVLTEADWKQIQANQVAILELLQEIRYSKASGSGSSYLSAIEFMAAVKIKRTKFDQLVKANLIRIVKKGRRIYVPQAEVERFFSNLAIK